jgi:uncharacterized protein
LERLRFDPRRGAVLLPIAGLVIMATAAVAVGLRPFHHPKSVRLARVEVAVSAHKADAIDNVRPLDAARRQLVEDSGRAISARRAIPAPQPDPAPAVAAVSDSSGKDASAPAAPAEAAAPAIVEKLVAPAAVTEPWRRFARPFDLNDPRPLISVVVAGADDNMESAIESLPPAVTVALDPYARRLPTWIELARARGHEVLLTLSVPPLNHGRSDAGPMAILSSLDPKENLERLDWALNRASGFVGVLDIAGNWPTDEAGKIVSVLEHRGLMLVDSGKEPAESATLPLAAADAVLMPDASRAEIDKELVELEALARQNGRALAIGLVNARLLHRVAGWVAGLERKSIALAPASALAAARKNSQTARQ